MQTSVGAPGRTRTCNPRLRRPMLYPVELQAQNPVRANIPRPDSHSGCRANPVRPAARRVSAEFVTPSIMATPAQLVGVAGFEPATYCSQSSCATRLRYTPASRIVSPILHAGVNEFYVPWQVLRTLRGHGASTQLRSACFGGSPNAFRVLASAPSRVRTILIARIVGGQRTWQVFPRKGVEKCRIKRFRHPPRTRSSRYSSVSHSVRQSNPASPAPDPSAGAPPRPDGRGRANPLPVVCRG